MERTVHLHLGKYVIHLDNEKWYPEPPGTIYEVGARVKVRRVSNRVIEVGRDGYVERWKRR